MTIALIGPSGAGKGTQAIRLSARFNLLHISTGDLFRESLAKHTALGLLARKYMHQGELVPDEVVEAMIEEWLWKVLPEKRILFDGFPQTKYQANSLDKLFHETDRYLETVIYLKVSDEEIIKRLSGRVICKTCQSPYHLEFNPPAIANQCDICHAALYRRDDDTPEIIRARLKTSHRVMDSLVDHYQETGKLLIVDGEGEIDQVFRTLVDAIKAVQVRQAPSATREESKQIQALKGQVSPLTPAQTKHHSLDIVLLGAPGAGKGTQADHLKTRFNLQHIATGDLFRENLRNETDLGRLAKSYMDRGELVPDDVTEAMVQERLSRPDVQAGFVLDGFPRTVPQAEALTEMMTNMHRRLDGVLYINVSDEAIVERLSGRLICRNCQTPYHLKFNPPAQPGICNQCGGELYQRDDDNPDTIRARLKSFHGQTAPVIAYYKKAGLLIEINGEESVSMITQRIIAAAEDLINSRINKAVSPSTTSRVGVS